MTLLPAVPFRYLSCQCADAATNMAIDEAILEAHLTGLVSPTLRLYRFEPPAISLGHTQKVPEGLLDRARAHGFDVVRRPTGGRAVLHFADLTYSFVASSKQRLQHMGSVIAVGRASGADVQGRTVAILASPGAPQSAAEKRVVLEESVAGAYKQICRGLQNAFNLLGLDLDLGKTDVPYRQFHDCFLATTGSDLQINGKKMVGSAQLRRKWAVLQHGSILLDQPQTLLPELLGNHAGGDAAAARHANLFDVLGTRVSDSEIEESMRRGFESALGVQFQAGSLTPEELHLIDTLKTKYPIQ